MKDTLNHFLFREHLWALHCTIPPVFHRASSWPITQMRAVETLENEDEVIFLLDLKDGGFRVVLSSLRRTTE